MKFIYQWMLGLVLVLMSGPALAQGLTGYYQSIGLNSGSAFSTNFNDSTNFGNSTLNHSNSRFNANFANSANQNSFAANTGGGMSAYYNNNGFNSSRNNFNNSLENSFNGPTNSNFTNRVNHNSFAANTGGGLSAYYRNNGITTAPGSSPNNGGFTRYFGQNLQANTFTRSCPNVTRPPSITCQGGTFQPVTDNYGCTVEYRCEGGQFCPDVERPAASQCNGVWEPQYSSRTQCLTHYFCDRSPDPSDDLACTQEYDPVCGALNGNLITYSNQCHLNRAGARYVRDGQCGHSPDPYEKPVINSFAGPSSLNTGETGTWKVEVRTTNQSQLTYSVDWGDNFDRPFASQAANRFPQNTTFTHQYNREGTFQVRVTVRNERGQTATATTQVKVGNVRNTAPTISSFTGPNTLEVGQTGTWQVRATHLLGKPIYFSIDWGERNTYRSDSQIRETAQQQFQKAYQSPGTYRVTVRATSQGQSVSRSLSVRVTEPRPSIGRAPVVHGVSGPTNLKVNQTGTWRIQASDPQNQDLRYQINWGDQGQYGAQANYSGAAGFVQNSAFTHQYSQPGTYTVTVTVMNSTDKTARTTITVRVTDEPVYEPYQPYSEPNPAYRSNPQNYNSYHTYNINSRYANRYRYFDRNYSWQY